MQQHPHQHKKPQRAVPPTRPQRELPQSRRFGARRRETPDPAASDPALNGPDVPLEEKVAELAGDSGRDNQTVFIDEDQIELVGDEEADLDVPVYEGELEAEGARFGAEHLEALTDQELRDGETDDPSVAAEEGLTYIPPTDPPIVPSDDLQGAEIAAGFGSTSQADPYAASHHDEALYAEDEVSARVRDALRADAQTADFAERLSIDTEGGRVILRGTVDSIDDTDAAAAVAEEVEGVTEVIDRLRVRGL